LHWFKKNLIVLFVTENTGLSSAQELGW